MLNKYVGTGHSMFVGVFFITVLSACETAPDSTKNGPDSPSYDLTQIANPARDAVLLDSQHHFRIELKESRQPAIVSIPINAKHLRNTDINTLTLVRHIDSNEARFAAIGPVKWSDGGEAVIDVTESGIYSLVGAPADALSRSLLRSYCGNHQVPRLCQQIDCAAKLSSPAAEYVPGMPPCDFCTQLQPNVRFADCLIDFRDVLYPVAVLSLQDADDSSEPVCEFRKVFDDFFCSFRPQAGDEDVCRSLADEFNEVWSADLTGQSCVCGTRVRSAEWDPVPNGCTDSVEGQPSCVGWNWNCEVVSD